MIVSGHVQGVAGKAHLSITGSAHLCNILSAVTLALAAGLKPFRIWDILPSCSLPSGRNQWIPLSCGAKAFLMLTMPVRKCYSSIESFFITNCKR